MTRDATGAAIARAAKSHASHCDQGEYEGSCKYGDDDCPEVAEGRRRARPSSYHRMKQRAEIAEAEEARLCEWIENLRQQVIQLDSDINALLQVTGSVRSGPHSFTVQLRGERQPTWRHDLSTVVGGVLLAFGLIAAIVWGVWF